MGLELEKEGPSQVNILGLIILYKPSFFVGIIMENWICERKRAVWVSAPKDLLLLDAARDLEDIGVWL